MGCLLLPFPSQANHAAEVSSLRASMDSDASRVIDGLRANISALETELSSVNADNTRLSSLVSELTAKAHSLENTVSEVELQSSKCVVADD